MERTRRQAIGAISTTALALSILGGVSDMPLGAMIRGVLGRFKTEPGPTSTTVDSFEDGDISEYGGDTGAFDVVDSGVVSIPDGSNALRHQSGATEGIASTTGLDAYPSPGDTFRYRFRFDTVSGGPYWFMWASQSEGPAPDNYFVEINDSGTDSEIKLMVRSGTNTELDATSDIGWTAGEWYDIEVTWAEDGSMTVTVYDSNGTQQGTQLSATDTTWSSGGVGFRGDSTATVYWDHIRITEIGNGMAQTTGLYSSWAKDDANNPVLSPSASGWDNDDVLDPAIVDVDGTYHMIYRGDDGSTYRIGHAYSDDLINWTKDENNPILDVESGTWESTHLRGGTELIVDEFGTAHAFYRGYDGSTYQIGHATSDDFSNWTKDANNPVLSPGGSGWRSTHVNGLGVVKWNGKWHAIINGYDGYIHRLGHATSDDLSSWTWDTENNPVMSPSESYDTTGTLQPSLRYVDGTFELIYNAVNGTRTSAYASSKDLISWVKDANNPVLEPSGSGFDSDAIRATGLIQNGSDWVILYTGEQASTFEIGKADAQ